MDYGLIVEKIKKNLVKEGFEPREVNSIFGKANPNELAFLNNLYETYSTCSQFYQAEDLISLTNFSVPLGIIDFYRDFEPQNTPILSGGIKLLSLSAMKEENSGYAPSIYFIKFGVITIANSIGGNVICMDLNRISNNEPRIIIADHNLCSFNEDLSIIECVNVPDEIANSYGVDDPIILSYDIIDKSSFEISKTFSGFLMSIADKQFTDIEDYLA